MSNQPLSLRERIPELNDSQWQLLERELLAVLPEKMVRTDFGLYDSTAKTAQANFNSAIDQATDSIRKALSK